MLIIAAEIFYICSVCTVIGVCCADWTVQQSKAKTHSFCYEHI